jgi:hypothetical protein
VGDTARNGCVVGAVSLTPMLCFACRPSKLCWLSSGPQALSRCRTLTSPTTQTLAAAAKEAVSIAVSTAPTGTLQLRSAHAMPHVPTIMCCCGMQCSNHCYQLAIGMDLNIG